MGHISTILVLYVNYAGFNACYDILFCLFLSTCVLQSVCVHTMDFVSAHKQMY